MKHKHKLIFGLLFGFILAGLFMLAGRPAAAQASFSASWIDRSNIQVTGAGKTIILNDRDWDETWHYAGSVDGCNDSVIDGFADEMLVGFSNDDGHTSSSAWNQSLSKADLTVYYKASASATTCTKVDIDDINISNWQNARMAYRWTDGDHTSIERIDNSDSWTFGEAVKVTSGFGAGKTRYFSEKDGGGNNTCRDVIDVSADGRTMWLYEQVSSHGDNTSDTKSPLDSNCWLASTIDDLYPGLAYSERDKRADRLPSAFPLPLGEPFVEPDSTTAVGEGEGCTTGADCNSTTGLCEGADCYVAGGSGIAGDSNSCEARAIGMSLRWLVCPVLDAGNALAEQLRETFEAQLSFTLKDPTSPNTTTSAVSDQGLVGLRQAWSVIRVIASSLIIILLLVMIISEALGGGPFDAYTVRKVLPKLVIAVVLIQVSWSIFVWVINAIDELGRGLAAILYQPFGGAQNMDLWSLMNNAGISTGEGGTYSWIGLIGIIIATAVAPFIILLFLFTATMAILTGLIVLIFRKIIIILALILAPIALLAWVLPGTQRYWKLWSDNLMKALFMFPLAIAIIAAGRIFAYVTSTQGTGTLINFLLVLVGFFGPLFILPKTFQWGGGLMRSVGNSAFKAKGKIMEPSGKFLKGRQEGYSAERKRQSQERYSRNQGVSLNRDWRRGFGIQSVWQRPIDLVRSGRVDPTLSGRRRRQAMDSYVFAGIESEEKDLKAANARAQHTIDNLHHEEDKDVYARLLASGQKARIDSNTGRMLRDARGNIDTEQATDVERRAGRDQMVRLGGEGNMAAIQREYEQVMQTGDHQQITEMNKFLTANVGTLFKKMPQIYKNANYATPGVLDEHGVPLEHNVSATIGGLGAGDLLEISGASLTTITNHATTGGDNAGLERLSAIYRTAVTDQNMRGRLTPAVLQAIYAHANANPGYPASTPGP